MPKYTGWRNWLWEVDLVNLVLVCCYYGHARTQNWRTYQIRCASCRRQWNC